MTDATAHSSAPTGRTGRRVLLVFAVLLGLFLMHGMSASADAACATPAHAQTAAAPVDRSAAPAQAAVERDVSAASAPSIVTADSCACDHAMASCTPLTGRNTGAALGALLLALAALSAPRPTVPRPPAAGAPRARRRPGIAVLDLACVSRT